jgi:hypothetical protein
MRSALGQERFADLFQKIFTLNVQVIVIDFHPWTVRMIGWSSIRRLLEDLCRQGGIVMTLLNGIKVEIGLLGTRFEYRNGKRGGP